MSKEEFERLVEFLLRQQAELVDFLLKQQAEFDERMNRPRSEFEIRQAAYDERMSKANAEFNEKFGRLSDVLLRLTNTVENRRRDRPPA